jgi:hypothetical protein
VIEVTNTASFTKDASIGTGAPTPVVIPLHCAPKKAPCPKCGKHGTRKRKVPPRKVRTVMHKAVAFLEVTCGEYQARCGCCTTFRNTPEQVLPRALYDNKVRDLVLERLIDDGMSIELTTGYSSGTSLRMVSRTASISPVGPSGSTGRARRFVPSRSFPPGVRRSRGQTNLPGATSRTIWRWHVPGVARATARLKLTTPGVQTISAVYMPDAASRKLGLSAMTTSAQVTVVPEPAKKGKRE